MMDTHLSRDQLDRREQMLASLDRTDVSTWSDLMAGFFRFKLINQELPTGNLWQLKGYTDRAITLDFADPKFSDDLAAVHQMRMIEYK